MKKSTFIKRFVALFLVVLMSINTFAAVVGDNDGAAFITKAEFDSMKNDFQSQLDRYNSSIDNKIDGAIASYLSGIWIAKVTMLENQVENYADILWRRKFEIYGNYRDRTSDTSSTTYTSVWFQPHFQKLISYRYENFNLVWILSRWSYAYTLGIYGIFDFSTSNLPIYIHEYGEQFPATLALNCDANSDDIIILKDLVNPLLACGGNVDYMNCIGQIGSPGTWNGTGWPADTHNQYAISPMASDDTTFEWLRDNNASGTAALNVTVRTNHRNSRTTYAQFNVNRGVNEFGFFQPLVYPALNATNGGYAQATYDWARSNNFYALIGGHWYTDSLTDSTTISQWADSMLGDDSDVTVNLYRKSNAYSGNYNTIKTTYSDFYDITWNISRLVAGNQIPWTADTLGHLRNYDPVPVNLHLPYYERYPLRKITSGKFKAGTDYLLFGSGLPITNYIQSNGKIEIEFDYVITKLRSDVVNNDSRIKVDLKKSSFISESNDYWNGIIDDGSEQELRNAHNDGSNHVKITLDNAKAGDSIWFRIAPLSTTSGLAAKISNLKVKNITN